MYLSDYLSENLKPGKINSSLEELNNLLDLQNLSHLPLFDGLEYIGCISKEDLKSLSNINNIKNHLNNFYVRESNTLVDAIQNIASNKSNIIPLLTEDLKYIGCLTDQTILQAIYKIKGISEKALSIVLSVPKNNIAVTTISNIIEINNGKIYGIFLLRENEEEDYADFLVRFSASEIEQITETFERYGYRVIQKFYNDKRQEMLSNRYKQLLKYINT